MAIVVFIGPKGPTAWQFSVARGVRKAVCINDGTEVTAQGPTSAELATALQAIATHTVALSGAPTLVVPIEW